MNISDIIVCPSCSYPLKAIKTLVCNNCYIQFSVDNNIPLMFFDNNWDINKKDVQIGTIISGYKDGGLFIMIGKKND